VARWNPDRRGVIREWNNDRPLILTVDQLEEWRRSRRNLGLYTSVYQYDQLDVARARRVANLYFDLDDQQGEDWALSNARTLVAYLINFVPEEAIRIYFTGQKGFHVEVEQVALGVGIMEGLSALYRCIATGIKNILELTALDFSVYDARRMWRLPNSEHQHSGLFKVPLTAEELELDLPGIWELALRPRLYVVPEQHFDPHANEWLRQWMAQQELDQGRQSHEIDVPKLTNAQAQRSLEKQIKQVCVAEPGGRNNTLNRAAFILGMMVKRGLLPHDGVQSLLLDAALEVGLEERESRRTIHSGMTAAGRV
jgi:hypothetical protein